MTTYYHTICDQCGTAIGKDEEKFCLELITDQAVFTSLQNYDLCDRYCLIEMLDTVLFTSFKSFSVTKKKVLDKT